MYVAVLRVQPLGRTTSALHSRYVSFSVGAERSLICIYLYSLLSSLVCSRFLVALGVVLSGVSYTSRRCVLYVFTVDCTRRLLRVSDGVRLETICEVYVPLPRRKFSFCADVTQHAGTSLRGVFLYVFDKYGGSKNKYCKQKYRSVQFDGEQTLGNSPESGESNP